MNSADSNTSKNENGNKTLFESDRKLRTLVGNLPGIVYRCHNDKKWTMEFISNGCYELTGYTSNQFYGPDGISWGNLIHKDDREEIWSKIQEALATKQQFHLNYRVIGANNKVHWVSEHGIGVPDQEGKLNRLEGFIENITRQKEAEDILKTRNRALNAAGKGIIIADAKVTRFPIIYVNEAFETITGYKKLEVMGKNCDFLQSDDKNQEGIEVMRNALKNGSSCKVVLRNYKKDGSLFWNELAITPVRNKKEELTHFIAVQNDITDRKNEEKLKDHKRLVLEMIIKNSSLTQITSNIVKILEEDIQDSIVAIWKFNQGSNTLGVLSAPNFPKDFRDALNGVIMSPKSCSCGIAGHLKQEVIVENMLTDPSWHGFESYLAEHNLKACWSYPLLTSSGEVLGVLAVYQKNSKVPTVIEEGLIKDTTQLASLALEQYVIREALQHSQRQLETYTQNLEKTVENRTTDLRSTVKKLEESNTNLADQIYEKKVAEERAQTSENLFSAIAKNFPKGVILLVNDTMEIIYMEGTALERIRQQKTHFEKIKIDDLKNFSKRRKAIFKDFISATLKGEHLSFEMKYRGVSFLVNTTPLQGKGNGITHALMVFNDISERKKAEYKVQMALKKEQELNELKSRFISMASHEFRTPLSIILSSATLIEKQNNQGKEEVRLRHTKQIKSNVQNLVVILNDFLSLSKLEEGAIVVHMEWFDLVRFSKFLLAEIEMNKKAGQTFEIIHKTPEIQVYLDPKLMRHILSNLLGNAVKYSNEDQHIIMKITQDQYLVSLEIIDEGIGIPKEEQKNLFQRFFRAKNSLDIQGTGLGLHIVKQYTDLMDGTISFKSEQDQGSTFRVDFPSTVRNNELKDK